jgi:hypothetical protein
MSPFTRWKEIQKQVCQRTHATHAGAYRRLWTILRRQSATSAPTIEANLKISDPVFESFISGHSFFIA